MEEQEAHQIPRSGTSIQFTWEDVADIKLQFGQSLVLQERDIQLTGIERLLIILKSALKRI